MSSKKIPAGEFKTKCLQLMDKVKKTRRKITITKRNVPVAELSPIEGRGLAFGSMKGTIHILGDIIEPLDEVWNADT